MVILTLSVSSVVSFSFGAGDLDPLCIKCGEF